YAPDLAGVGLVFREQQIAHGVIIAGARASPLLHQAVERTRCGGERLLIGGKQMLGHSDRGFTLVCQREGTLLPFGVLAARAEGGDVNGTPVENTAGDELAKIGARRYTALELPKPF